MVAVQVHAAAVATLVLARTKLNSINQPNKKRPANRSFFIVEHYLPRKYESTTPKNPKRARLRMSKPVGTPVVSELGELSVN